MILLQHTRWQLPCCWSLSFSLAGFEEARGLAGEPHMAGRYRWPVEAEGCLPPAPRKKLKPRSCNNKELHFANHWVRVKGDPSPVRLRWDHIPSQHLDCSLWDLTHTKIKLKLHRDTIFHLSGCLNSNLWQYPLLSRLTGKQGSSYIAGVHYYIAYGGEGGGD